MFILSSLIGISVIVFVNFVQPYLLSTQLHVAQNIQGRIVSQLSMLQELVALALVPGFGYLSDRIGRRPVFTAALSILAIGLMVYPLAGNLTELAAARLIVAVGAAAFAATLATIAADYPSNESRGKLLSVLLVSQQLAILLLVAKGAARLPAWLSGFGINAIDAGHYAFWIVAAFSAVGAATAFLGLKRGGFSRAGSDASVRVPNSIAASAGHILRYAISNPRFMVVLAIAFVVRGDASAVNTFLSLWAVTEAKGQGLSAAIGLKAAGTLLFYLTLSGLTASLLTGWLADRLNRLKLLGGALLLAALGHGLIFWITDLHSPMAAIVVCLLGAGEMSLVVSGQALLGQEAPAETRGAAIGLFGFFGSLGVLSINAAGGILFDKISSQSPFVFIGVIDLLIFGGALFVLAHERARRDSIRSPMTRTAP